MKAIETLREIYPHQSDQQKELIKQAVEEINDLKTNYDDLASSLDISLPEAPTSATVKVVHQETGFEWLFTVRGVNANRLLSELVQFGDKLSQAGFVPASAPRQPASQESPQGDLFFEAIELVGSVHEGKAYWKIKGGQFSKFGVTIWPEVLGPTGFDVEKLNPMEKYPLNHKAYYVTKEDGTALKVVRLVPNA